MQYPHSYRNCLHDYNLWMVDWITVGILSHTYIWNHFSAYRWITPLNVGIHPLLMVGKNVLSWKNDSRGDTRDVIVHVSLIIEKRLELILLLLMSCCYELANQRCLFWHYSLWIPLTFFRENCGDKIDTFLSRTFYLNGGYDNTEGMTKLNALMEHIEVWLKKLYWEKDYRYLFIDIS